MNIQFTAHGWKDYLYWQSKDKTVIKRINQLIKDILRSPYEGIGKPEPLKFDLTGFWSRRITREHRLVYMIRNDVLIVLQCRYHYDSTAATQDFE